MPHYEGDLRAHPDARFAVLAGRWHPHVVDALVTGACATLQSHGVAEDAIDVVRVPGVWELPLVARDLARAGLHVAIVALGCVVRGDTRHYEEVADGAANGLMQVALETGVPVLNGVLAVERMEDALARAGGVRGNKGEEATMAAIEMVDLQRKLAAGLR
ncbi:6,7-dimethyl-8-ribityllumazine synthase [Thermomonas sp.]|uniref:6,7-dimethyl-8-ribityllumazine synthase n=1 Tax=Thermomonas sp. TaxID=1971895 RepID=UPI001E05C0C9|nr:6,7-dimethyl-8-ribityllumazine synthase [Thermomonas sp.]MBZ0088068.1 6,7-dimethyl-8-ribityllumazine synthase [Thermomonas sp.]MCO5054851.1 6,7-dimethyl-8-ribityllumazine synthase [Thermomonas sp.]HRO64254.1 6,7-dimethyl-8-ribityllumazine synthase [Thermomonas sp.]